MRAVSLLAVITVTAFAGAADAAPARRVCTVTDATGDVELAPTVNHRDARLDIVSAGLAGSRSKLGATLRVADLATAAGASGLQWEVVFTVGGTQFHLVAERLAGGDRFELRRLVVHDPGDAGVVNYTELQQVTAVRGTIDVDRDQIRLAVPLAGFSPARVRAGSRLESIRVHTREIVAAAGGPSTWPASFDRDEAETDRTYVIGTAGCAAA